MVGKQEEREGERTNEVEERGERVREKQKVRLTEKGVREKEREKMCLR